MASSSSTRHIHNENGQVAFFVALIFQVLFVFFAMIINVGLLVHHKINLQNSVDLAAYYGAARQAETLNAVAHINYQIRQAYKLMMFRYHGIGTAGDYQVHPWDHINNVYRRVEDIEVPYRSSFCMAYSPLSRVNPNESYCGDQGGIDIDLPTAPELVTGFFFLGFQAGVISATEAFRQNAIVGCRTVGELNWFALARFIAAYKMDVRNRKQLLITLAKEISKDNPNDIEGGSIREGVYRTLFNNLTYQNKEALATAYGEDGRGNGPRVNNDFKFINGLSVGDCASSSGDWDPPGWLSEINIFPYYYTMDAICDGSADQVRLLPKPINLGLNTGLPNTRVYLTDQMINEIKQIIDEPTGEDPTTRLFKSSLGFEKSPWCPAYVAVSAKTTPAIPFSPLGSITLEAKAYAKPFGGRIGPWYGTTWPSGSDKSSPARRSDQTVPIRVDFGAINIDPMDPDTDRVLNPNHSRYIGDEVGIRSDFTMGEFGKAVHQSKTKIDFNWWDHIFTEEIGLPDTSGDPLAWDGTANSGNFMRDNEIKAVMPDQFDINYYSIEPDFYNNYLKKIEMGYPSLSFQLRGDLGSRMNSTDEKVKGYSIKDQILAAREANQQFFDITERLTYTVEEFGNLLTAWQGRNPNDYSLDPVRFASCQTPISDDAPPEQRASGHCVVGGRTGYSVKLVDSRLLKEGPESASLELGGAGVRGRILNPLPSDF